MNLDELRKVAEAATPGPWHAEKKPSSLECDGKTFDAWMVYTDDDLASGFWAYEGDADMEHIATFDPPTVLALLDVTEAASNLDAHIALNGGCHLGCDQCDDLIVAVARLETL